MKLINKIKSFFKPKYSIGDTIYYRGILYDEKCKSLPLQEYKSTIESVHGNWFFGYWYTLSKPEGTLYRPAVFESRIVN